MKSNQSNTTMNDLHSLLHTYKHARTIRSTFRYGKWLAWFVSVIGPHCVNQIIVVV